MRHAELAGYAGDHHHVSALLREHGRQDGAGHGLGRKKIYFHEPAINAFVGLARKRALSDTGIENQNINAAKHTKRQLRFLRQLGGIGHVHRKYASVGFAAAGSLNTL